jgi:gingipain R
MYHCLYNCNRIEEILIKPNLISKQKFGCANRFINSLILPEEITTILYVVSYLYSSLSEYNKLKLMRQKQGYTVYEIVIQENETFEVIKTKINTLHSRNKLKYICIIGNEKEIATNMRKVKPVNIDEEEIDEIPIIIAASDLMYGVNYNKIEIIVGRISSGLSENETNIKNQINKILTYEKLNDDLNIKNVNNIENKWSSKVIGIASDQYVGSFKDNEYMRNELKSFETNIDQTRINITYVELFEGYIGENVTDLENIIDKTGNPTSAELETYINNGATLIEYLGHGTDTLLRTTNFDITNVDNLNNINKYFLFISAACLIGAFHNDTLTLAEKFQFAKDSGSIAVFASSVEQSWEPPKKMLSSINKLIQKSPEKYITIGDLFYQGVTDHEFLHISLGGLNEDDESYYYNLFGDPSTKYNLCKLVNTLTDVNTLVYRASASKIRRP